MHASQSCRLLLFRAIKCDRLLDWHTTHTIASQQNIWKSENINESNNTPLRHHNNTGTIKRRQSPVFFVDETTTLVCAIHTGTVA
jgi:hypothetical protein